jgi:hypothetical protein
MLILGYSAYRTHVVRGEVGAALAAAEVLKGPLAKTFERSRDIDALHTPFGPLSHAPAIVAAVGVERGRIDIRFGEKADRALSGRQLSLTPYETAALELVWICGHETPGPGLRPLGFAGGGPRTLPLESAIEPRYLPQECR